jgi:signal transduction histidine kinase
MSMTVQSLHETDVQLLVNMVIHDLEKPLKVIERLLERIQNDEFDVHNARHTQIVNSSLLAVKRSQRMLNDLNDVLLLRTLPVHKLDFDLHELIEKISSEFVPVFKSENIKLNCINKPDVNLYSDPELIQRILENYLFNALHHTPSGHDVSLEVRGGHDGVILITVKNSGQPIPNEFIETIFQPGVQLNLRSQRKFTGHGLGLAFCSLAADALGYTIKAENFPGDDGVTFSLRIN